MAKLLPDVRLVLVLRDPVERAWSQAVMELCDRGGRAFDSVTADEWLKFVASESCAARNDYATSVSNWREFFPEERLHIAYFDDVKEQPRALLEGVYRHLGLGVDVDWCASAGLDARRRRSPRICPRDGCEDPGRQYPRHLALPQLKARTPVPATPAKPASRRRIRPISYDRRGPRQRVRRRPGSSNDTRQRPDHLPDDAKAVGPVAGRRDGCAGSCDGHIRVITPRLSDHRAGLRPLTRTKRRSDDTGDAHPGWLSRRA